MNNMFVKDIIKEVKGTVYLLNGNKEIIYEYSNISSEDKEFENIRLLQETFSMLRLRM